MPDRPEAGGMQHPSLNHPERSRGTEKRFCSSLTASLDFARDERSRFAAAILVLALLLLLLLFLAAPAFAQSFAVTNARIADGLGGEVANGTVVVEGGRIVSVGSGPAPAGLEQVDAGGAWVTPGIVAPYSILGLVEVNAVSQTNDTEADRSPYSAALDVRDAVNPNSSAIGVARIEGVTRAAVVPSIGRDLFGGKGAVITLAEGARDPVVRPSAFQVVALGERGAAAAGGARTASFARLRDAFAEAAAYARNRSGYEFGRSRDSLLTRADADALVDVIEGRTPAMVSVDRASDIRRTLELGREYPRLDLILVGAAEGWLVADEIARAGVPVIAVPMQNLPGRFETIAATQSNIGRMKRAGVTVAVADVGSPSISPQLPQQAAQLVAQAQVPGATGLSHGEALATITSEAADVIGLEDAGRLAPGARADIVIWDGDPLESRSAPTAIFIDGVSQPMQSRQTRLADRYNPAKPKSGLPPQYTRTR